MKIQLRASDGTPISEAIDFIPNADIVFPIINTPTTTVVNIVLIPENQINVNHEIIIDGSLAVPAQTGDCVCLKNNPRLLVENTSNKPSKSCSNCEYFYLLHPTKICNALQTPSENIDDSTDCPHWEAVDRYERQRRQKELQAQVRRTGDKPSAHPNPLLAAVVSHWLSANHRH